jgi:glutamate racemase
MKIGIFDSGLGGLIVARAIQKMMPEYEYVYLGDTKRVPYGNRSHSTVYEFTLQAVDYLFRRENCAIIIIACNTASARALRRIQQEYLPASTSVSLGGPENFPQRKVLGVLIPAAEEASRFARVGVLGTLGTVSSGTFPSEIKKINLQRKKDLTLFHGSHSNLNVVDESNIAYAEKSANHFFLTKVFQNPAPMLVPLAEEGETINAIPFIKKYLKPFRNKNLDALVLGCTHYPIFKKEIRKEIGKFTGKKIKIISQDEIIPKKLKEYFKKHPEIESRLSKNKKVKIVVTDLTQTVNVLTGKWFGKKIKPQLVKL